MPRQTINQDAANGGVASSEEDVLILTEDTPAPSRAKPWAIGALFALTLAVAALVVWWLFLRPGQDASSQQASVGRVAIPSAAADLSVIFSTEVMPLTPEDAQKQNDERPIEVTAVAPARPFAVTFGEETRGQYQEAVRCLAQAIYYEAATEPEDGQRAVAQVVLNRVRHPAYPQTVCGVVYQGSERVTGCQFTFTCDGSLARKPVPGLYARSERLAREALSGRVAPAVGTAVNYHADYVVPYWARSLLKIAKIGAHIFYGFRGALGDRSAFRGRYDLTAEGFVPLEMPDSQASPTIDSLPQLPNLVLPVREPSIAEDARSGQLLPDTGVPPVAPGAKPVLEADRTKGELDVGTSSLREPATKGPAPATPSAQPSR